MLYINSIRTINSMYTMISMVQFDAKIITFFTHTHTQRVSAAREEGLKQGQSSAARATPAAGASKEEVATKVKAIMNQAFQTLSAKYKAKATFESKEILSILVTAIKVGGLIDVGRGEEERERGGEGERRERRGREGGIGERVRERGGGGGRKCLTHSQLKILLLHVFH